LDGKLLPSFICFQFIGCASQTLIRPDRNFNQRLKRDPAFKWVAGGFARRVTHFHGLWRHRSCTDTFHSVTNYSTKAAILTLEHNHPVGNTLKALVDVNLQVDTMKSNEARIGEWLNVMGYVKPESTSTGAKENQSAVNIQAIFLWSAGPLNLKGYERSLDQQSADDAVIHKTPCRIA
jgi:hypothetical protein